MVRTEEQQLTQAPITVVLGGEEHEIKPLVIRDSRKWREDVAKLLGSLPQYANVNTDDPVAFEGAMNMLVAGMSDSVVNLFFQYAKDLPREEIEGVATDAEVAEAFKQVVSVAFPLANSLAVVAQKLGESP